MSVQDIADMADPVLRNLWITQRYHEFAVQLHDSGAAEDATWYRCAVWASKTAGTTIRGELLPARASQLMAEADTTHQALHRFNHGAIGWAVDRLTHSHLTSMWWTASQATCPRRSPTATYSSSPNSHRSSQR